MQIGNIKNPFDIKSIQGVNGGHSVEAAKKIGGGEQGSNPFASDNGMVGIGIKDGAVQTSNGQMGKPKAEMRQLGIA